MKAPSPGGAGSVGCWPDLPLMWADHARTPPGGAIAVRARGVAH
ncbi:hypothetical protein U879_00535 [Defluviimonas sp. 20V17]|nr:hypothetical protein U879_00535 [Defluviimonas sp. 20V17]